MSFRIGVLVALLIILATALWFIPCEGFQILNTSAPAPVIEYQPRNYPARTVSASGPAPPNQEPPPEETRVTSPEVAMDPYEPNEESAAVPERLRHPERMYRPAPSNSSVDIAEASGIASASASQAAHSLQAFAPEMAQNGGEFMHGIFANDSSEPSAFSAF